MPHLPHLLTVLAVTVGKAPVCALHFYIDLIKVCSRFISVVKKAISPLVQSIQQPRFAVFYRLLHHMAWLSTARQYVYTAVATDDSSYMPC